MHVELTKVLLRDPTLTPGEILMSESQERMMAVVTPRTPRRSRHYGQVERRVLLAGRGTDTGRLIIDWDGETIVDVDPRTVAHDGPVYERPYHRPEWLDGVQGNSFAAQPEDLRAAVLELMSSPNMCSKDWVTNQFDRYVQGNTALAMPDDAGVIRVDEETGLGVAISTDANDRYSYLNPYEGARLALAEAYRNVATSGAKPLAVTDCLNFGSPEDPEVMWQFAESVRGLADACQELGVPVTGGNVSLYNQTGGVAIHPTPVVGVLGVFDDVARRTPSGWREDGQAIYLLGTTRNELDGLRVGQPARPPRRPAAGVDLRRRRPSPRVLVNSSRDGMIDAAHDLSEAGSPRPFPRRAALRRRSAHRHRRAVRARRHRSVHRTVQREPGPRGRQRSPLRGGALQRHVHRPELPDDPHRRRGHGETGRSTCRGTSPCRWPS
jgi:phosphoribosylformylglycinamidine synthase